MVSGSSKAINSMSEVLKSKTDQKKTEYKKILLRSHFRRAHRKAKKLVKKTVWGNHMN